jgi:peptide/nickel transport system substrate-binding protein
MLEIHASERFIVGIVSGVLQPVVVSKKLRNVPEKGRWGWDPGAQFGMYRMDSFWIDR